MLHTWQIVLGKANVAKEKVNLALIPFDLRICPSKTVEENYKNSSQRPNVAIAEDEDIGVEIDNAR